MFYHFYLLSEKKTPCVLKLIFFSRKFVEVFWEMEISVTLSYLIYTVVLMSKRKGCY